MAYRKLGRNSAARKGLIRSVLIALIKHERIQTTEAKAKELRGEIDHLITLAKRGDLHARRQAAAKLNDKVAVQKLFDELVERFQDRQGGYTRILKLDNRKGDAAPMVMWEFVD